MFHNSSHTLSFPEKEFMEHGLNFLNGRKLHAAVRNPKYNVLYGLTFPNVSKWKLKIFRCTSFNRKPDNFHL